MKKIVFLSLVALCLPWTLAAQSVVDDLYYVPSKKEKAEQKKDRPKNETVVVTPADEVVVKSNTPMTVHASDGQTTVVVRDAKGNTRDVDEYNRRYEASDYDFTAQNDTLYIDEKPYDGLDGEWVGGEFEGSADDYEYATRIIRFRNPRYAIPISSPLYFDVVYGLNTWDWNVYYDGFYAYAFPTFTNRLWWDWRFNSYGWWGYPYYGWGWSWNSWYGSLSTGRRTSIINGGSARRTSSVRRSSTGTNRRVVGTRSSTQRRSSATTRTGVSSSVRRSGTYTRPSNASTIRRGSSTGTSRVTTRQGNTSVRRSSATYNRGSSTSTRNSMYNNVRRSSGNSRSYSTPSRSSSSRSSISTGGSSFRSSGGGARGGGVSRSSGGGSRRR